MSSGPKGDSYENMLSCEPARVRRSPALAEFYVTQDPVTKNCDIVETKPDGKAKIMVGASSYATKDEAKAARRKASDECRKPGNN
jgi:hypothetical protein